MITKKYPSPSSHRARQQQQHNKSIIQFPVFGYITFISILEILASTIIVSFDGANPTTTTVAISTILDIIILVLNAVNIVYVAYLIFGTRGIGHYSLTIWRVLDALIGNMLANVIISTMLWKIGAASSIYNMFSHTGKVSVWYALYDLMIYSFLLINGGGVVDNIAVNEAARLFSAFQEVWNTVVIVVIIAATIATLQMHTDEGAKLSASSTASSKDEIDINDK
jgi:hypothetical protein